MPRKSTPPSANNSPNTGPLVNSHFHLGHLGLFVPLPALFLAALGIVKRSLITRNSTTVTIPSRPAPRHPTVTPVKVFGVLLDHLPVVHAKLNVTTTTTKATTASPTVTSAGRRSVGPQPHLVRILPVPNATVHRDCTIASFIVLLAFFYIYSIPRYSQYTRIYSVLLVCA